MSPKLVSVDPTPHVQKDTLHIDAASVLMLGTHTWDTACRVGLLVQYTL